MVSHQFDYQAGDHVWLYCPVKKVGKSSKLMRPWVGPYQVTKVLSPRTYKIVWTGSGKRPSMIVHHDRLKPCVVREDDVHSVPVPVTSGELGEERVLSSGGLRCSKCGQRSGDRWGGG